MELPRRARAGLTGSATTERGEVWVQVLRGGARSTHQVFPHLGPVHRWEARVSTCNRAASVRCRGPGARVEDLGVRGNMVALPFFYLHVR